MFHLFDRALASLLIKELRQITRNKQIIALLLVTPTIQLIMYGYALDPQVKHLRMGIVDYALSPNSRELTSSFVRNEVFDISPAGESEHELFARVNRGQLDAGVVIPPEFERDVLSKKGANIQVALNGVDANTAGIAASYVLQIVNSFNQTLRPVFNAIVPQISFMYNPGLISSWFFAPAVMAMSLNIAGTLVSSSTLLREKETGTIEQLMMTPADSQQIIIAKIVPLIGVLFGVVTVSLTLALLIFHVPFRGNPLFFAFVSLLYMFVLIALGLALASFAANQRQAMLTSFFIMMPLIQLSGALSPIESMPIFFKYLSLIDPLRFYVACLRGILLKGNGIAELSNEVMALVVFAVVLMSISVNRFRKQLA